MGLDTGVESGIDWELLMKTPAGASVTDRAFTGGRLRRCCGDCDNDESSTRRRQRRQDGCCGGCDDEPTADGQGVDWKLGLVGAGEGAR